MNDAPLNSYLLFYETEDGRTRVEVRLEDESVWLSQKLMAELFQKDVRTVNEHIQNIYAERELTPDSTIRNFRIVQKEGGRTIERKADFYNLDVIISVGYRIKSSSGTQFRIWATSFCGNCSTLNRTSAARCCGGSSARPA